MTENAKTITFVLIGLVAIAVGLLTRPSAAELDVDMLVNENLTKKFESPEQGKRLRIVRFDEDTATLREFEVAEQDGLWSIPSKDGYPADAARQMAEASTSLIDRKILSVASRNAVDHEQYGVVDPLSPKLEPGQKGVGTRVTMRDDKDEPLADLIIGKPVKDAEGQRYVREAGRDIVYVIEIDPSKLTTSFENWIEKDLLKLNSWDLQQVEIKDYSAELVPVMTRDGRFAIVPQWDPRSEMTLSYDDSSSNSDSQWNTVKLRRFDPKKGEGEYIDFTLAEDEELNEEKLNGLKNALDDLQIVDVERKPAGLSADLKAGDDFMNNREALESLGSKGFTAAKTSEAGPLEIISSDGEVIATMKNGTEYVLRFGDIAKTTGADEKTEGDADAEDEAAEKPKDGEVNRYLFVMARFNESAVKQPELQPLPELPAGAEEKAAQTPAEPASSEEKEEAPADSQREETTAPDTAATEEVEEEEEEEEVEETAGESESADAQLADDAKQDQQASDGEKDDAAAEPADAAEQEKADVEKIIAERKRIEQENQRKLDEYQELRKKGQENVKELNLRFGDWYFVVSDSVFRKIRLSREDVIKKKETKVDDEEAADTKSDDAAAPAGAIPGLPDIPGVNQ